MTRVIKIGGRAQSSATLARALFSAWTGSPGSLVVVHGGGDELSALQRRLGRDPSFIGGRRVTTSEDINLVRMVLSGSVNKRLVATLVTAGLPAVGISGEDGGLITAQPSDPALGKVGSPTTVNASLLEHLAEGGFLPVVSPLARDATDPSGGALNVNGDDAAAAIAVALGADELLFVADVAGVMVDGDVVATLDWDGAYKLLTQGIAAGGMRAKIEAARDALEAGVARVRIGNEAMLSDPATGTTVQFASTPSAVRA